MIAFISGILVGLLILQVIFWFIFDLDLFGSCSDWVIENFFSGDDDECD